MKRCLFLAVMVAGTSLTLFGEDPASAKKTANHPNNAPAIEANDPSGNLAMKGDAEIQSEIGISLSDHEISGLQWKVTDKEIDISGNVSNKRDKELAHEIAEAFADGRKVHDHIRESASAGK